MEILPRDESECQQFDCFCKLVLRHEARDYFRELHRHREKEVSLDYLQQSEWNQLFGLDRYPSDYNTFSTYGYELHIENEMVAAAFSSLSKEDQNILILRYVLELTDREIGILVGFSRSAVQRHRTRAICEMRKYLVQMG